jgi:hypothetical protein
VLVLLLLGDLAKGETSSTLQQMPIDASELQAVIPAE